LIKQVIATLKEGKMTFSEFRQFLAATSSFREQVPCFSRSFSAPISNGPSSGIRGSGLGDFTANSVGRLAGDGKGTGKEAVGYFERLFQIDSNTVEGDFDVFTSPRLAVCRPAATVAPARPAPSLINTESFAPSLIDPDSSAIAAIIENGRRKSKRMEIKGKLKVKVNGEVKGEGGEGEGVCEAAGIKDPGYSLFFDEDDMMSGDYLFKIPDNKNESNNNNEIDDNEDHNSDDGDENEEGRGKVTVRNTFSRHFTTPEKVSPKPKRAFYGNKGNFHTEDAKVAGEEDEGEAGSGGRGGGGGGGGEKVEGGIEGREIRSGRREGYSTDELCKYWQDNEDRDREGEESEAKPSPFYTHTMCQLDQLEGTEGMRSL
jgi:hypothetical protein